MVTAATTASADQMPDREALAVTSTSSAATTIARRHPLVLPAVATHAAAMLAWSALRHAHYGSHAMDLGAYEQVFWNLGQHNSLWSSIEHTHQWSNHLEIGLVWLWLPYRIYPTVIWLFMLQSVCVAATAVVVEIVAREASGSRRLGLFAALATLAVPQLFYAETYDFHSITLCALPMALLVLGIERDRPRTIALAAAIALSLREQMGLAVAFAALAWLLRHGKRRWPAALALGSVGVGVFLAEVLWLIPSFDPHHGTFRYASQYGRLGGSPSAALRFALVHPLRFILLPFEGKRLLYPLAIASAGTPLALASLAWLRRAGWPLLIAAPLLLVQMFNDRSETWSIHFQYGAPIAPLFVVAAALALSQVALSKWQGALSLTWLVGMGAHYAVAVTGDLVGTSRPIMPGFAESPRARALARAARMIPDDASVSAQPDIVPHVCHRGAIHEWPYGEESDRFVVLDVGGMSIDDDIHAAVAAAVPRLRRDERFTTQLDEAGVAVFERRAP